MNIRGDKDPWDNPCCGICSASVGDEVCTGCGRTLREQKDWPTMSREERIEVNAKARKRL